MKHRVEVDVSFNTEDEAIAFLNLVEMFKVKTIQDSGLTATKRLHLDQRCRYHECYHDEDPVKACGKYLNVDFDGILIAHTNSKDETVSTDILIG